MSDGIEDLLVIAKGVATLAVLFVAVVGPLYAAFWCALRKANERLRMAGRLAGPLFAALAVLCTVAGQKVKTEFAGGIVGRQHVATNDLTEVYFEWSAPGMPPDAGLYVEAQLLGESNAWRRVGATTVGALSLWVDMAPANATNYEYLVWADWTPPEPLHTNGVWTAAIQRTKDGKGYVLVNGVVEEGGRQIAPPKQDKEVGK